MRSVAMALTALVTLALVGCGGDTDDGDGGRLMVREEQRVKEWLIGLGEAAEAGMGSGQLDPDDMISALRRMERADPPTVDDGRTNTTMREFHTALSEMASVAREAVEMMSDPSSFSMEDMGRMAARAQSAQASAVRMGQAAQELAEMIEADFADDPEFMAELQQLSGGFGGGMAPPPSGGGLRSFPQQP